MSSLTLAFLVGDKRKQITRIQHEKEFRSNPIGVEDVSNVIKNMKSKSDCEFINANVLIDALPIVGETFAEIINNSFKFGIFPDCMKQSVIIPVPKMTGTNQAEKIRPINMLPTYEKVIEKLVDNQLQEHLDLNDILIPNQSGYRKQQSCETALNLVIDNWKQSIEDDGA